MSTPHRDIPVAAQSTGTSVPVVVSTDPKPHPIAQATLSHPVDERAERKQQLLARSTQLRKQIHASSIPLRRELQTSKSALRVVNRLSNHPEWLALLSMGVNMVRPNRLGNWMRTAASLLHKWRMVQQFAAPLLGGRRR